MASPYLNNPDLVLDLTVPAAADGIEATYEALCEVAIATVPWPRTAAESIECRPLFGGITNSIYLLTLALREEGAAEDSREEVVPERVIIRIFGRGTELFVNRAQENRIFARLSIRGAGPTFHGLFNNGRVEGFLDARSLEPAQMYHPRVAPRIAHALATFHSNDPGSGSSSCGGGGSEPNLWDKIETFISLVQEKMRAPDCADKAAIVGASVDVDHYIREYFRVKERICSYARKEHAGGPPSGIDFGRAGRLFAVDVVLCHNDLLSGNILLSNRIDPDSNDDSPGNDDTHTRGATLIDFEYSGPNYRAFDIVNHFCEYCGFDFTMENIRKAYPCRAYRHSWFHTYLQAHVAHSEVAAAAVLCDALQDSGRFDEVFGGFDDVVNLFQSTSHFFWGFWSLFQCFVSAIDFDYALYARQRFHGHLYFSGDVSGGAGYI